MLRGNVATVLRLLSSLRPCATPVNSDLMASQFDFTIARCPRRRHFTLADFTRALSPLPLLPLSRLSLSMEANFSASTVSSKRISVILSFEFSFDEFSISNEEEDHGQGNPSSFDPRVGL